MSENPGKYTKFSAIERIKRAAAPVNVGAQIIEFASDSGVGIGTLGAISYLQKKHDYDVVVKRPKH